MVYAVEASGLANIIPKVAKENNFSDVIKVRDAILEACNEPHNRSIACDTKIRLLCVTNLEFTAFLNYYYSLFL
jgi:hypothetical protein